MHWGSRLAIAFAVVAGFALSTFATLEARAAGPTVGMVTKVQNQAQVGGEAAAVGTIVHLNDSLRTGANARLQVTFRDNTNLTLGENASVVVDRYVFDPDAGVGEATLNATKGALRIVTGRLSDMPNKDIKVSTPLAALAVRGTDFWTGEVKGQSGVLLMHASRLEVSGRKCPEGTESYTDTEGRRRCRCRVFLDKPEYGTYIDPRTGCPGIVRHWTPGEIAAAQATVTFGLAAGAAPAVTAAAVAGAAAAAAVGATSTTTSTTVTTGKPPSIHP